MPKPSPTDQFSDEEMEQLKRHGAAMLSGSTFSDEVEKELDLLQKKREASAGKMRAAQTGGAVGLGPSDIDQAAVKQRGAISKQSDMQSAQQAAQAQGAQAPVNAPPAPTGPQGETIPYTVQKGAVGGPGNAPQPTPPPQPPAPPTDGGQEGPDPAEQWPDA